MRTDNILVMDLGNGNVGIGTTAPGYKLEVGAYDVRAAGSTVLSGVKINRPDNSGTQGIFFGEDTNTNSGNYWENMHVRVDGGGGNIIFDTAGTERVRIDCSGNVGIGTTGPSQKLHIVGNEYITGNLVVDSYVTAGTEVRARSGVTDDGSSANLLLFTNNNGGTYGNIIMNSAGGNVGIGTTSPTEMLHVAKNIDAGSPGINIENSFTNIAESIDEKTKIESLFGGWTASYIYTGKEEDFTEEAKRSSYMSFWTRGDGTLAEAVRINSSGNVGIGTTSPGAKLQVNGNITVLAAGGTENYIGFNSPANPGAFTAMIGSYHTVNWGGDLRFYTQITGQGIGERMRIDGAGNVGIGTTEPDTMLTAYKASAGVGIIPQLKLWTNASANDGTEGSSIDFVASGDKTAVGSRILATRVAAGAHMDLRFHTQRDVEQMRITSTGNVGIGTTSPGAKLEVKQTSNVEALLIDNNGTDMSLHITQDGVLAVGKKALYVYSNASHVNAATSLVRFHQDGDSSTMPAAEIYNDGTGNTLSLISYGNGVTQELDNRGTNHGLYLIQGAVLASNKYSLYVYSNAVQVNSPLVKFVQDHASSDQTTLYIDNDGTGYGLIVDGGNVGIGTTSPGQLLHVNGNKATNFIAKVENTNADNGWGLQVQSGSDSGDYNLHLKNKADTQVLFWVKGDGTAYHNGNVGIGTTNPTSKLYVSGNIYTTGNCSALSFTDRTPYPKDLETAYASVFSMERLPDGKYDENNKERQLEHSKLHPFIKAGNGRDLSATVSAQNEVIKSLVKRIESLEATIEEMRQ